MISDLVYKTKQEYQSVNNVLAKMSEFLSIMKC